MKIVLQMHHIESAIRNRFLSAAVGELPPHETWPQLWVSDADFQQAQKIIAAAEKDHPDSGKVLICTKCGEEVEGQFFECWNCGSAVGTNTL